MKNFFIHIGSGVIGGIGTFFLIGGLLSKLSSIPIYLQYILIAIVIICIIPGAIIGTGSWIMMITKKQDVPKKFRSVVLVFVLLSTIALSMEVELILQRTL